MESKQNIFIVALLALAVGLFAGYAVGTRYEQRAPVSGMHDAMHTMTTSLDGKRGDELDKAFLDEMIVHHQGAIEMAQTLIAGTNRPELIKLGNDIISAQTSEIRMMQDWNSAWFGK